VVTLRMDRISGRAGRGMALSMELGYSRRQVGDRQAVVVGHVPALIGWEHIGKRATDQGSFDFRRVHVPSFWPAMRVLYHRITAGGRVLRRKRKIGAGNPAPIFRYGYGVLVALVLEPERGMAGRQPGYRDTEG